MTNEQLHVLLSGYAKRLRQALAASQGMMPESAERMFVRRHTAEGCGGFLCLNGKHFEEFRDGEHVALFPVAQLAEELEADVEALRAAPSVPA